jgi:polynucleotide 5'-hydroxyl-kinase GRC3/NOL9
LKILLVRGPVVIRVYGECYILGVKIKNQQITWDNIKALPIEKVNGTRISLIRKKNMINSELSTNKSFNLGMSIWKKISDEILKKEYKRVVVIGPADSGKSTFSLYLANRFIGNGERPLLVDADVGQGDLAPPTCIGSVLLTEQKIDLSMTGPDHICFIGSIQPSNSETRIIRCTKRLITKSGYYDRCIINTDGYTSGKGIHYKLKLLEKTKPDCIVCLGNARIQANLRQFLRISNSWRFIIIRGRKPHPIINRTQVDRYRKRMYTLSKFITQNNTHIIQKHINDIKIIHYKNRVYRISHVSKNFLDQNIFGRFFMESAKGMAIQNIFVGLGSSREMDMVYGFGIIKNIEKDIITILTTCKYFDSIYISDLRINMTN